MALKMWLPLNGNLNNQGLNTYTISNTGVVDSLGKIGSCYSYSQKYTLIDGESISGLSKFTISCWVYLTNASTYNIFASETADSGYWQFTLGNNYIRVRDSVSGATGSRMDKTITAIPSSVWVHITVIYDEGIVKVYQNGVLKDTLTFHSGASMNTHNKMCLGADVLSGVSAYPGNCKINDFRVYDHCLSDKEVSEISKGLVLHYKLSENYQTLDNCYAYPTFDTSSNGGGWYHWAPSNNTGTYSQNTDRTYIYRDSQTYSHYVEHTSGTTYYLCHQSPAFEGGYRSAQAIIKMPNGEDPREHVRFAHNANVGTNPPVTFTQLEDDFWLMKHEGFQQSGSDDLVAIRIANNKGVYISEAYLENDKQVCSDIFNTNVESVSDCSGYGNDGTLYGDVTSSADSARYDLSTKFGSEKYIVPSVFPSFLTNEATVSMWVKLDQLPPSSPGRTMLYTAWCGFSCEITSSGSTYFRTQLTSGNQDSPSGTISVGEWVHWVGVKSPTGVSLYLDGVLVGKSSNTANFDWSNNVSNRIASYSNSFFLYGNLSDVRLYATALSDKDIKELHSVGASIDNKGNLLCYMANEGYNGDSRELGPHIDPNSTNVVFNNDGSFTISGRTFPSSKYIPINPTNKKYYYDIEYSNVSGNLLYIGFERYDVNKQSGSNSECQYMLSTTDGANHRRIKGVVDLSTANGNTAAYTKLRILNDWNNTGNSTYKSTIHHISLKEVIKTNTVDVTQKGVFNCDEFIESSSASINDIGNITCNQLIEI